MLPLCLRGMSQISTVFTTFTAPTHSFHRPARLQVQAHNHLVDIFIEQGNAATTGSKMAHHLLQKSSQQEQWIGVIGL